MSSLPTISYIALDENDDPDFTGQNVLSGAEAVAQAVLTRLRLFSGEWWEDTSLGLPVFQNILGQLGSQRGKAAIEELIYAYIADTPYVTAIRNVDVTFANGVFSFHAVIETVFGTTTVAGGQ